jgi:hypothetical protein
MKNYHQDENTFNLHCIFSLAQESKAIIFTSLNSTIDEFEEI